MRNVIVTGGSRGIGLAIVESLAASGHRVVAVARHNTPELAAAAASCAARGNGAVEWRPLDLADLAGIPAFVRRMRAEFGPFYGLVNNAGIGTAGVLGVMRDADIERLVRLNTTSPMLMTKYVLRSMMVARDGRVVNIASVVALTGYEGLSVYSATKASLIGFTQSLAREVGPLGITVNAIAPGFMNTEMTGVIDEEQRRKIARRSALRRAAEPVDVARSVDFLLGDGGRNVTGIVLTVDAGNTA